MDHDLPCDEKGEGLDPWRSRAANLPSIDAVATKSAVASIEISTMDAMWGLYDLSRLPVRSRMCTMPPCVPKA